MPQERSDRLEDGAARPGTNAARVPGGPSCVARAVLGDVVGVRRADGPRRPTCAASSTAAGLDAFFTRQRCRRARRGDYPHAYALPDGRTLWLFQDAFVGADDQLGDDRFAHNAALVQSGDCFELLPTSGGTGTSWIGSWVEHGLQQWFWPLDAEVGADGYLWLFLAEVHNPNGSGAATGAEPVATWRARYRLPDLELVDLEPAADASRSLFGYSIVSDDDWTYLFGHCYRQYVAEGGRGVRSGVLAVHLRGPRAARRSSIASWSTGRVPAGRHERAARQPVLTGQRSMPVSVERFGDVYVAASDEDDWFGSDVVIRTAPAPQGPWTEVLRYTPETRCAACNNYGAFILPHLEDGQVVIAHSNNAWDMRGEAFGRRLAVPHRRARRAGAGRAGHVVRRRCRAGRRVARRRGRRPGSSHRRRTGHKQSVARDRARRLAARGVDSGRTRHAGATTCCGPCAIAGLALAAAVALVATTGFATTARRAVAAPPSAHALDPRARRGRHPRPHGAATARAGRRRRPLIHRSAAMRASRWRRRRRRSGGPAGGSAARRAR